MSITVTSLIGVKRHKEESADKLNRRFKRKVDNANLIQDARLRRYFEPPSQKKRRKTKVAAFTDMLRRRYENK